MRPVAVYDTNILFSAVGWGGVPYRCLALAQHGSVEGITCSEILEELAEKLCEKLNFSPAEAMETTDFLLDFLRQVQINNTLKVVSADPDDDKVIECAVVGGATHIITGDSRHLLPLGSYQGIFIVKASDFLALAPDSD